MATQAHCAYCFECLAASFENRRPLELSQVEELWGQYRSNKGGIANDATAGSAEDDEEEQVDEEEDDDAEMTDADVEEEDQPPAAAKPAAISRLLNRETSAGSSSSSLQSTRSTASSVKSPSTTPSGAETPASSTSSLRSRFSLSRRREAREEFPLFVTWNTVSRSGYKSLRGCIGTFEPQELQYGLKSYALTSAFEDIRFQPIPSTLLPQLSAHVTLLTNFSTPTKDPLDWTLGVHGIRISFSHHGRRYGATYLPDVAKEQGWTKEETMVSLMRKAGWNGSSREWGKVWRDGKGEVVRYEGRQVGLGYEEWKGWRDWVEREGVRTKPLN